MMRRIGSILVALSLLLPALRLAAQSTPPAPGEKKAKQVPKSVSDAELLRVADESFTVGQIAAAYDRGISKNASTFYELPKDSALAFVNLYADFRLKVRAAMDMGLDKTKEFKDDMDRNRDQVALGLNSFGGISGDGYLFQRKLVDPGIRAIFSRRNEELKIAVIFAAMNANNPADTLRAWNKASAMLKQLKQGVKFETLAADSSDDVTTKGQGGVIGWITGGMVLRELEDAAWGTKKGEVYQKVIPLSSGYVLLKVMDRQERRKVHAAHILFEITKDINSQTNDAEAKKKADAAMAEIRAGKDFAAVAREKSEDKTSGANGGDLLSWYTRSLGFEARPGKLDPTFEEALFNLKDGQVSDVVKTDYGYHIIKRIESTIPTFEEEEKALRDIYKNQFIEPDRARYTQEVLKKQGMLIDEGTLDALLLAIDTNRSAADTAWASHISPALRNRTFFKFQNKPVTVGAWVDSVETTPRLRALPLSRTSVRNSISALLEYPALKEEAKNLEKDYPDFARLMGEFHDGALIFDLEQKQIYGNVSYNEEEGRKYFKEHEKDYVSPPKLDLSEIFLYTESNANGIYKRAKAGEDFAELASKYTERQNFREKKGKWGMNDPKNSELVRKVLEVSPAAKKGSIVGPIQFQGGWSIVKVDDMVAPTQLSYDEARGELMANYNDWKERTLRKEMIASFRKKYPVTINQKALEAARAAH